jgi:hypothetical protein
MVHGELATTDSDGQSVCLTYAFVNLTLPSYYYTGPINTDPVVVVDGTTVTGFGNDFLDLTSAYPDEELFKQCKYIMTNPPPVFLTPVNSIKLPQSTLPKTSNAASPTPTSPTTPPTTSASPATPPIVVPSSTTSQRPPTVTEEPSPPAESDSAPSPSPPSGEDEDEDGNESTAPSPTVIPGTSVGKPENTAVPPTTTAQPEGNEPIKPVTVPASVSSITPILGLPSSSPPDGNNEGGPAIIVGGSTTIVAGGGVAVGSGTTFSVLPSSIGIVAVADGSTSTLPLPTAVPSVDAPSGTTPQNVIVGGSTTIVAGGGVAVDSGTTFSVLPSMGGVIAIADERTSTLPLPTNAPSAIDSFVQPMTSASPGFVLPGQTLSEGGEAVLVGGTSFSALPFGSGVVAISEGGSTTLQSSQLSDHGISTAVDNPDAFVLPGQTLAAGGSAAVIDSATYSALPGGSGINVASGGQTSVISAAEATNIPGVGEIRLIDDASGGYVLGGSIVVIPGGTDATVSGTVYIALPSGFGVLASSDADEFAAYIEQGLSGEDQGSGEGHNHIVGIEGLSGQATTVSGVVYSVLPSGSGVLVVANGQSITLEIGPTGDNSDDEGSVATATGGSDAGETVVPYTGGSASQTGVLSHLAWVACLGVVGVVGACLVL